MDVIRPNYNQKNDFAFDKANFDDAVNRHGNHVKIERAIPCPCRNPEIGSALIDCLNCGGTGWSFANNLYTRVIMQNMTILKKYRDWSEEDEGTTMITANAVDRLGFMDKITVMDAVSVHSELLFPVSSYGKIFSRLSYQAISDVVVFAFQGKNSALKRLVNGTDFILNNDFIEFINPDYSSHQFKHVSIRYMHYVTFHVLEILRDIRINQGEIDCSDILPDSMLRLMPMYVKAKKAHTILNRSINPIGDKLFDNSIEDFKDESFDDTRKIIKDTNNKSQKESESSDLVFPYNFPISF